MTWREFEGLLEVEDVIADIGGDRGIFVGLMDTEGTRSALVEDPTPVLVKVRANGICRSDWHLWQGHWDWMGFSPPLPAVLGHESAGVVEEVGSNIKRFKKGDRVVFPFGQACGHCDICAQGDVNLVTLPEGISFVDGASLGCRFMTAFHGITAQGKVEAGEWVAVFGCGGVGLAAVHVIQAGENTHEEIQE
ncbi:MAG: alcohol dehydrogenase catalytic domain-containing protein [Gemmatimonadota bacterium]